MEILMLLFICTGTFIMGYFIMGYAVDLDNTKRRNRRTEKETAERIGRQQREADSTFFR